MAMNSSGIRDTARELLQIYQGTVMSTIKKGESLAQVNTAVLSRNEIAEIADNAVSIVKVDSAEADEMWSFAHNKGHQRWL